MYGKCIGKILKLNFSNCCHKTMLIWCTSKFYSSKKAILTPKTIFKSIKWVSRKIKHKNFHYKNSIEMYGKCMDNRF